MILIIGGAYQGKLAYALELTGLSEEDFVDGAVCTEEELMAAAGVNHFHEWIRRCVQSGGDCSELAEELFRRNPALVVISNELGCGIVPFDRLDRRYRETAGRVCTGIAGKAEKVFRVVCGIGYPLKDENND